MTCPICRHTTPAHDCCRRHERRTRLAVLWPELVEKWPRVGGLV